MLTSDPKPPTWLVLLAIAVVIPYAVLSAWTLSVLWGWFIVPVFPLPPLRVIEAFGIVLVVRWITRDADFTTKDERTRVTKLWTVIIYTPLTSAFVLGIGWLLVRLWW